MGKDVHVLLKEYVIKAVALYQNEGLLSRYKNYIKIEVPFDNRFGDFTTNIAIKVANYLKEDPCKIAQTLSINLEKNQKDFYVQFTKRGYINFTMSREWHEESLYSICKYNQGSIQYFQYPNSEDNFQLLKITLFRISNILKLYNRKGYNILLEKNMDKPDFKILDEMSKELLRSVSLYPSRLKTNDAIMYDLLNDIVFKFNLCYADCRWPQKNKKMVNAWLVLLQSAGIIIKDGLEHLTNDAPGKI